MGNFTDGKTFIVEEEDMYRPWSGGKDGVFFRCYLCGHKFVVGDKARWIYTNSGPHYSGNPMVCEPCDTPDVLDKWDKKMRDPGNWIFKITN